MTENNNFNNTENDSTNSRNKKRFTLVFDHEHDGIGRIEKDNIPIHNSEVVEMLNELSDENEQLKKSVKRQQDSNNECAKLIKEQQKENEQLKQFKKSVFALINEKITFVNECEKNHNDIGIPHEYYRGADEILNLLKKELDE